MDLGPQLFQKNITQQLAKLSNERNAPQHF